MFVVILATGGDVVIDCEPQAFGALPPEDLVLSFQVIFLRLPGLVYIVQRKAFGFFLKQEDLLGRGNLGFRFPSVAIFKLDEDVVADDFVSLKEKLSAIDLRKERCELRTVALS